MSRGIGLLAAGYARRGWWLVRLFGCRGPSHCSCPQGKKCASAGKHPAGGNAWHLSATNDEEEVSSWFDGSEPVNIGLVLGPRSGVVDVELDGPEAEAAWNELGLGEIYTPTYRAGRGPHRLFRWDESLPAVGVKKVAGIEIRIGGGGRASQSVIPPSVHHSGVTYQWADGLSPDDVELQPLPEKLLNLLWNDDGTRIAPRREPASAPLRRAVKEGSRNNELYRFAVAEAFRCGPAIDDAREQQDLLLKIACVNAVNCKPPLAEHEVTAIYRSAVAFVRKTRAAGMDSAAAIASVEDGSSRPDESAAPRQGETKKAAVKGEWKTFAVTGLSYSPQEPDSDSEWGPGEWTLVVVHSDPLEYRLIVPAWRPITAHGTGSVTLTVDQFCSAAKVAKAVLAATGTVMLDEEPGKWKRIWEGGYKVTDNKSSQNPRARKARGVKAKLLDNPAHEWPGASSQRYVALASWLYDRLSQAAQPSDDDIPDPSGRACWRSDGTLWFAWSKVWEDIESRHRVEVGEKLALKRRILAYLPGEADFVHKEFRHAGGQRRSYVVWTHAEFGILETLASQTADPPAAPPAPGGGGAAENPPS